MQSYFFNREKAYKSFSIHETNQLLEKIKIELRAEMATEYQKLRVEIVTECQKLREELAELRNGEITEQESLRIGCYATN